MGLFFPAKSEVYLLNTLGGLSTDLARVTCRTNSGPLLMCLVQVLHSAQSLYRRWACISLEVQGTRVAHLGRDWMKAVYDHAVML